MEELEPSTFCMARTRRELTGGDTSRHFALLSGILYVRLPWIAAGRPGRRVIGHLFYYGEQLRKQSGDRLTIYTGGDPPSGGSTKVLWMVRPLYTSKVIIAGRQLDGAGTFEEQFRSASSTDGTVFPSIVDVPNAGCWLLTIRNGPVVGRFAVVAIASPS
jgi:hypothetical protein